MKNYSFQGLRAIFAIGVLFSHCYFLAEYTQSQIIFDVFLRKTANVSFFFMISGFFLVESVMRTSKFSEFIKKKLVKIYPLHIVLLAVLVGKQVISGGFDFSPLGTVKALSSALLLQTWIPNVGVATSYNTVSWFLSSLLFCYVVGYWIARLVLSNKAKCWNIVYILTGILLAYKIVIAVLLPVGDLGYYLCYLCPVAGLSDFLIGVIIWHNVKKVKTANAFLQAGAIMLILGTFVLKNFVPANFSRAFLTIPANILLIIAFANETNLFKKLLGNKVLTFIGDLSFEVYLSHAIIISVLANMSIFVKTSTELSPFITLLLLIGICLLFAFIYKKVYEIVVKNIEKVKHKCFGGCQYGKQKN